jgi:hypothetical protein
MHIVLAIASSAMLSIITVSVQYYYQSINQSEDQLNKFDDRE